MAGASNAASSVYDYVPLTLGKSMYIRVIQIRPSTMPDFSDDLICDFSVLDIDKEILLVDREAHQEPELSAEASSPSDALQSANRVEFQALSYTWGSSDDKRSIILGGTSFLAGKNLWDFLDTARKCNVKEYLWIDAICINQTTVGERSHQVSMMGKIYSQAACVIVWLGNHGSAKEDELREVLDSMYKPTGTNPHSLEVVSQFGELGYWYRAWIVQEYYLAKRKQIWYGRLQMDAEDVSAMVEWYKKRRNASTMPYSPAADLIARHVKYDSRALFGTFTNLAVLFQYLYCGDRRDYVYAMLPLLKPRERRHLGVSPDYSKSATHLFLQLVVRIRKGLIWSNSKDPHVIFPALALMLRPDLQARAVQQVILDLRARGMVKKYQSDYAEEDHRCGEPQHLHTALDATGCSVCGNRPVVSILSSSQSTDGSLKFSRKDWKAYVRALLASEDQSDKDLGILYCTGLNLKVRWMQTRGLWKKITGRVSP